MVEGVFYDTARAGRRRALLALQGRETGMRLLEDRNRPRRLTIAAAHRLMQRGEF